MSKTAPTPRWFDAWRESPRVPQDDPADLGTAYGMEMSLGHDFAPPPTTPARRPPGWVQRLTSRRKPLV